MNEWVKWNGGECPVPVDTLVDVMLADGRVFDRQIAWGIHDGSMTSDKLATSRAGSAYWRRDGIPSDIIAYRIHKEES